MLTMSGGKTSGCLAMPLDRELPVSMSLRTSPRTRASSLFSVCSVRMFSARSSESPLLIMVANCRDEDREVLELDLLLPPKPGILSSFFIPAFACVMLSGA